MAIPNYWGDESVLFTHSWQQKLFSQIEGVSPASNDIRLNYIDLAEQQLPPVLSKLGGEELYQMERKDVFIIHGEYDEVIGFLCLSFQEIEGENGELSIYAGIDHIHILSKYAADYPTVTISCMLAFALSKYTNAYLLASEEDYTRVKCHITSETLDENGTDEGRYFYRIFKGQCKSPLVNKRTNRSISIEHYFMVNGELSR